MAIHFNIQDKFKNELPADPVNENTRRQVFKSCFSYVVPRIPSSPSLIHISEDVLKTIGLSLNDTKTEEFVDIFSGAKVIEGTIPYAMCYGGHQFGNWAGQLGDGRAINLTEIEYNEKSWMLQLKGAGETPYSRQGDGFAVLRSSIREHLCSEAMHYLGVPTTRSLSLIMSGDQVLRDMLYDGHPEYEKGAIVCRVAPSFIRFGNFQIFTSRGEIEQLKELTNFTIRHHFPEIEKGTKEGYIQFFRTVAERTREMVIHWQRIGFVHGVMNTDNMSIHGLTIDYGPYGWLEGFDPNWTPNTTDRQHRRYRYGSQGDVALWNLLQLANALYQLVEEEQPFQEVLHAYQKDFKTDYYRMMGAKIGLEMDALDLESIIDELVSNLQLTETDMTIFFRSLSCYDEGLDISDDGAFLDPVRDAFYLPSDLQGTNLNRWKHWFERYKNLLSYQSISAEHRKQKMNAINPKYVLRNYMAQMAIDDADNGNFGLVDELYQLLKKPYDEQIEKSNWFVKRPEWARHKVGCSMLSCSS